MLIKDGWVYMCMDFRDLNKESPKDYFPLPHVDSLVDNIAGDRLLSFIDGMQCINKFQLLKKTKKKLLLSCNGKHFTII